MRDAAIGVMVFGWIWSGVAVLFGLLAPVLWPRKDLTKANRAMATVYRMGLFLLVFGLVVGLLC